MYRKYWKAELFLIYWPFLVMRTLRTWNGPLTLSISFLSLKMTIFSSTRLQIWTSFFCHDAVIKAWLNLAITDSKIDIFYDFHSNFVDSLSPILPEIVVEYCGFLKNSTFHRFLRNNQNKNNHSWFLLDLNMNLFNIIFDNLVLKNNSWFSD